MIWDVLMPLLEQTLVSTHTPPAASEQSNVFMGNLPDSASQRASNSICVSVISRPEPEVRQRLKLQKYTGR